MTRRLTVSAVLALSVSACGGGSSSDSSSDGGTASSGGGLEDISGTIRYLGSLSASGSVSLNSVDISAAFFEVTPAINASMIETSAAAALDTCVVETIDFGVPDFDDDDFDFGDDFDINTVSAGDVIPVLANGASYVELLLSDFFGLQAYLMDVDDLAGPLPSNLTASIPGDEFPSFGTVSLPSIEPLVMTGPTSSITPSSTIEWVAGSNADAEVVINVQGFTDDGSLQSVDCTLQDDGSFAFPAATQLAMGSSFFEFSRSASRELAVVEQIGNAVLILTASSED